jgi:hypothetical protein
VPHVRDSCEPVPEVIPIGKRPNKLEEKNEAAEVEIMKRIDITANGKEYNI